ncbi:MAG: hypothetical protein CSB06_02655 [Bacteroidia bacterium]|nr:MAG: hypothetical protein CSB06_02655 [Bacteroidia bacterium]
MTTKTIFEFFNILKKDRISFAYRGNFSNNALTMATKLFKDNLNPEHNKIRNKLSFLMVESFQNIARYTDSEEMETLSPYSDFFMTRNTGDLYHIISANLVDNAKIPMIKERLNRVNSLDKKELNQLYREVLTNKEINEKGGAGLGFIEMVRKTKGKLPFDFVPADDKRSMFFMQIDIGNSPKEKNEKVIFPQEVKRLQQLIAKENILLLNKGDFSEKAIAPLLLMVEDNMQNVALEVHKKVFHFLVEILQNISKHGYSVNGEETEGIFQIGYSDNIFRIGTGNYIRNDQVNSLQEHLELLNSKNQDELNEMYRTALRQGNRNRSQNAGLGLIDLARKTQDPLNYEFFKINEEYSFYSLTVNFKSC